METKAIVLMNSDGEQFAIVDCRNRVIGGITLAVSEAIREEYGEPVKWLGNVDMDELSKTRKSVIEFALEDDVIESINIEQTWIY